MATSGSVDFQHSRSTLIEHALRICGVLREGVSASANQLTTGAISLNTILKAFQASGMPLWAIKEGAVFPLHNVNSVTLGPSGGHAATTWVETTLTAASAASDTTLTVASITGISASDQIGIELDNGNIDWTTVNGAPSGSTVTITTGVTTAAASGNHVYTYTSKTVRPLKIVQASWFDYEQDEDTPINIITRDEWIRLTDKEVEGTKANQIYYDPQLTRGIVYFYPRFQNGDGIIKIWFQRPFEDMDAAGDNLDFPQEWESAIVWELAACLAPEHGVPARKAKMIQDKALYEKQKVEEFGNEEGSVYLMPERRSR